MRSSGGGGGNGNGEEGEGQAPWGGYADWGKPEPTEGMASTITSDEVGAIKDDIAAAIENMGLDPSALDRFSPRDYSTSFRLPVSVSSNGEVRFQSFTFRLRDLGVSGGAAGTISPEITDAVVTLRDVLYAILKGLASLIFIVRVWRVIWG